ncbi:hypothetical protein PFISCL1PPCAC_25559, partial [Pristionchus fissidentatus]
PNMAEFVEQSLEELVPVFEQLQATQLLSEKEVNLLVKRCRRYDYRLQKSHKKPEDYLNYGEYLSDLLDLLDERRKSIGYNHKKEVIEYAIKRKGASVYRRLCERFQGKLDFWLQYIHFTSTRNMKAQTSKAFIQAMAMHPRSLDLRIKAAKWEWEENRSVENARRGLQLALRLHPESVRLWATLFAIELDYVSKLKKRRELLTEAKRGEKGEEEEDESITEPSTPAATDAVLQLRLAEIVMEQALETIGAAKKEEAEKGDGVRELLVLLWRACLTLDSSDTDAARLRATLEARMEALPEATMKWQLDVEKRLSEGENLVDALSTKDWSESPLDEKRWAMRLLKEKAEKDEDAVAQSKARELLLSIVSDAACTEDEYEEWARGVEEMEGEEQREVVERAVQRFSRRALFWRRALEAAGKGLEKEGVAAYADRINRAIEKAGDDEDTEEAVALFQLAIDTALEHCPSTVEKVFQSAIDSSVGAAHRSIKELRVTYLVSIIEGAEEDAEREKRWTGVEKQIKTLVERRPNSVSFYVHVGEKLLELAAFCPKTMVASIDRLIDTALSAAVAEHSDSDDAWIARCELLMARAPLKVADVYRRAILSLKGEAAESFIGRYTILQQAAAAKCC